MVSEADHRRVGARVNDSNHRMLRTEAADILFRSKFRGLVPDPGPLMTEALPCMRIVIRASHV